jgi:hypothetical protein
VILVTDDDLAELQTAFQTVAEAFIALGVVWAKVIEQPTPTAPVVPLRAVPEASS